MSGDNVVPMRRHGEVPPPPSSDHPAAEVEAEVEDAPRELVRRSRMRAPDWLSPTARGNWRRFVEVVEAEMPGWLSGVDEMLVAMACEHAATFRAAAVRMRQGQHPNPLDVDRVHGGMLKKHPAAQVMRDAASGYMAILKELGLPARIRHELDLGAGPGPVPSRSRPTDDDDANSDLYED